jgi:hypothetical protein
MGAKKNIAMGAALAAATGAYWLYGTTHSAKHRKMAKSWMLKARADVMDSIKKLGEIDREQYVKAVDEVIKRYAGAKDATSAELARVAKELKKSWHQIEKRATKRVVKKGKAAVKRVKKTLKKIRG